MTPSRRSILRLVGTAVCGWALLTATLPARADTLADIKARGKLIVGVKTDYPPAGYLDASGRNVGLEIDLARFIADKLLGSPDKIELVPVVAANRIQFLQQGRIDIILATLGVTAERAKVIDFSVPYLQPGGGTLIAPVGGPVTSWEGTKGRDICGIQGSYYNTTVIERFGAKLVNFTGLPDAYKALADHRCDGMVFDELQLRNKLDQPGWKGKYAVVGEPLDHAGEAIGVRKDEPALLAAVNKAVLQAEADGKMLVWEKQYGLDGDAWSAQQQTAARKQLGE